MLFAGVMDIPCWLKVSENPLPLDKEVLTNSGRLARAEAASKGLSKARHASKISAKVCHVSLAARTRHLSKYGPARAPEAATQRMQT